MKIPHERHQKVAMGDNLIKKAYSASEYTPELIQELRKCAQDPVYFIRNYVYLQHPKKGKMLFDLYDYQEELVRALENERWVIALLARQMGKTQTISMFLLWFAMFTKDQTILIASKNNSHAMEIMDRIRFAYEELPHWLKAGCKYYNKHNIEFDNGSRIISQATTEKTGRGYSISKLYLDELAFINPNIQENMWASLAPTLSTGGSAIISSTPNGDTELFAHLWHGAKMKQNSFKPLEYPWDRHPERGPEYLHEMKGQLGPKKFRQEVLCEFISSEAMLVDSIKLASVKTKEPVSENMGFKFWTNKIGGRGKTYLVGVDPATGNGSDFTVIQVVEFPSLFQVAELRLNSVHIPLIYAKIKWLLKFLRQPDEQRGRADVLWSFERNGVGEALVAMIQNDEASDGGIWIDGVELYNEDIRRHGVYTTGRSKLISCMQLKNLVEKVEGGLKINSEDLLFELKNFIAAGGSYQAKAGRTDDCVMAMCVVMKLINRLSEYDDQARSMVYANIAPDQDIIEANREDVLDQFGDDPVPFFMS